MRRFTPQLFCMAILLGSGAMAVEPRGPVTVAVSAEREQPLGWPVVIEVTLTNVGKEPIGWWNGGPDKYPGAEHFTAEVRYGADADWAQWNKVAATNGQYIEGSGLTRQLKPGESIVVPMAIPVRKSAAVQIRIAPAYWNADKPAECTVIIRREPQFIDDRRRLVIDAALMQRPPFWRHVAEQYADAVVIEAMLKLVTLDNAPITAGAARVLVRQKTLPESAGDDFAVLVRRWLARSPRPEWEGLQDYVVSAALKTQSEVARLAVLEALRQEHDKRARLIAIDKLRLSPGDAKWLRRAKAEIAAVQQEYSPESEVGRQAANAVKWLDGRLKYPQPQESNQR